VAIYFVCIFYSFYFQMFEKECDGYVQMLHPNQQRWLAEKKEWEENVYPELLAKLKRGDGAGCRFHDKCPCTPEEIMTLELKRVEDEFWNRIMAENGYGFVGSIDDVSR
jgi:hypothetical protein